MEGGSHTRGPAPGRGMRGEQFAYLVEHPGAHVGREVMQ